MHWLSAPLQQAPRRCFGTSTPPRCRLGPLAIPRRFCSEPPPRRCRYPSTWCRRSPGQRIWDHPNALPPAFNPSTILILIFVIVSWAFQKLATGYRQKQDNDSLCCSPGHTAASVVCPESHRRLSSDDEPTVPLSCRDESFIQSSRPWSPACRGT